LAGARIDAERYRRSCDMPAGGPDCRWFAKNGIDLHALDPGPVARALLDPRIKVAVAVQPELADRFAPESLALIKIPVGIIGLGNEDDTAALARVIPGARQVRMPDATSFSTFGLCTPQGAALLQAEGEDEAVCREDGPRSRAEIHAELARLIAAMLRKGFARQP
jgi:predicted dienelactone hydrolase